MSKILDYVINDIKNGKSIDFTQTDFTYDKYFDELRKNFLKEYDDNNTYLDYILEGVKSGILITEIDRLISYFEDPEKIAEFYLILAKHDMISYITKLSTYFLTLKSDGLTVLERLLNSDAELTLNKILNDELMANVEIAAILMSKGYNVKYYNICKQEKFLYDYEYEENKKLGIGPLYEEGENLLNILYDLFKNDNKSNDSLVDVYINSYRQALIFNYDYALLELKKLIKIKEKNMNRFVLLTTDTGAYFDVIKESIYSSQYISNVLFHETGHALHRYLVDGSTPDNLYEVMQTIKKNPTTLEKTEVFAQKYSDIQKKVDIIAQQECEKYFAKYYTKDKIKDIEIYLEKESTRKKENLNFLGIPEDVLNNIIKEVFTLKNYIKHQMRMFIEEYTHSYMRIHYGSLMAVSDILDTVYGGMLSSGKLVNKKGITIPKTYGHGIAYCFNISYSFSEMIAEYAAIVKDVNGKEYLDLLHSIIGDELYNLIINYYNDNILKEKKINFKRENKRYKIKNIFN